MTDIPLTLWDYVQEAPTPLVAGIAQTMRESSTFMDVIPFASTDGMSVRVLRQGSLPTISWRNMGASHGSAKGGSPDEVQETVYSLGNALVMDKLLLADRSPRLYDPRTYHLNQTVAAMARAFTDKAINGLPTDGNNPTGLYYRVMNDLPSTQRITADPAGGTAGLDISPDATSLAANINTFMDKLDTLIYSVVDNSSVPSGGGNGLYLLMNDTMMLRLQSLLRQSGMLTTTTDAFDRTWTEYKGAKFVDMRFKSDDSTKVIGDAELLAGTALTGGTATSIYCVRTGPQYFTGLQFTPLTAGEWKEQDDQVTWKQVVDWTVGIAVSHPRSVSRLYGLVAA